MACGPTSPRSNRSQQIGRALKECGALALDQGIKIQLEVHGRETARLPRIRHHADNHPAVWVCWNSNPEDLLDGGGESSKGIYAFRFDDNSGTLEALGLVAETPSEFSDGQRERPVCLRRE